MKVEAVHTVHHRPDPKGPIVREARGSQFELAERDAWMLKSGAVKPVVGEAVALKGKRGKKTEAAADDGAAGSDLVG